MFDELEVEFKNPGKASKAKKSRDRLPIPQGKLVIKKLSPRESEKMKRLGLTSQEILPTNFETIAVAAFNKVRGNVIAEEQIAGLSDTEDEMMSELQQKVSKIKHRLSNSSIDIESLPQDKRTEYLALISDHLAQYKAQLEQEDELAGLPTNLAQSVRDADVAVEFGDEDSEFGGEDGNGAEDTIASDIESSLPKSALKKVEAPSDLRFDNKESTDAAHQHNVGEFCARCGFPKKDNFDIMTVSDEEADRYLAAAATLSDYEQTRKALNGKLELTFRIPNVDDEDAVWQALVNTSDQGRALELLQRYRLVLQLVSVKLGNGRFIKLPGSYENWREVLSSKGVKDTSLEFCWATMKRNLKMTSSLKNVLFREMFMFNGIVNRLESLSSRENLRNF